MLMKPLAICLALTLAGPASLTALLFATPAAAETPQASPTIKQVRLTEQHVQGFIAMQKVLTELARSLESAGASGAQGDEQVVQKLEALARENGYASFAEFDNIAANITLVISGIDPDTGKYADPRDLMRADIEDIRKDETLTDKERDELIKDLEAAIEGTPAVAYPENIEVVRKFAREIEGVIN
ncbi:MAG: hypothetical protein AAFZ05_04090 [Pseudomonadota bacterium]